MTKLKRIAAWAMNLVIFSVLFAGSCVGPGVLYYESPRWSLKTVDPGDAGSFYVAFRSKDGEAPEQVYVKRYRFDQDPGGKTDLQYNLQNGLHRDRGSGKESASITATTDKQGGQLVQVFVTGDTPWTSLSEYRVKDNKIYPLRHANSTGWLLLGAIVCPIVIIALAKRIKRSVYRWMRIDPS